MILKPQNYDKLSNKESAYCLIVLPQPVSVYKITFIFVGGLKKIIAGLSFEIKNLSNLSTNY